MSENQFYIYTDASFSNIQLIGVCGFLIFKNSHDHETAVLSTLSIRTITFNEKTNIRAELMGAILALETINNEIKQIQKENPQENIFKINLYADCQAITDLLRRREKLEASNFLSQRKKEVLSNADLYQKFFVLYDQLQPKIIWVKGHSSKKDQSLIQKIFSRVDRAVRAELRKVI